MNQAMLQYLTDLDISASMRERIDFLLKEGERILNREFDQVFLEESDDSNPRVKTNYVNAMFLCQDFVLEFINFMTDYSLNIYSFNYRITTVSAKKLGRLDGMYDLDSSAKIEFSDGFSGGNYFATFKNCEKLMMVFESYILPSYLAHATGKKNTASPSST